MKPFTTVVIGDSVDLKVVLVLGFAAEPLVHVVGCAGRDHDR